MTWWKKAKPGNNVSEGDLAEFTVGPNKGRRLIVEDKCAGFSLLTRQGTIWHVRPLMMMDASSSVPWPDGYIMTGMGEGHIYHAKDKDLRRVPPEELDQADPRDVAAPKDEETRFREPLEVR